MKHVFRFDRLHGIVTTTLTNNNVRRTARTRGRTSSKPSIEANKLVSELSCFITITVIKDLESSWTLWWSPTISFQTGYFFRSLFGPVTFWTGYFLAGYFYRLLFPVTFWSNQMERTCKKIKPITWCPTTSSSSKIKINFDQSKSMKSFV